MDYPRTIGRTVTGGYVYRGSVLHSAYRGRYFVADFFGGIYSLGLAIGARRRGAGGRRDGPYAGTRLPRGIATFGRGLAGELYFSSFIGGRIFKIVPDTPDLPLSPERFTSRVDGSTVSLAWQPSAGGGPVLGYQLEVGSASGLTDLLVIDTLSDALVVPEVPRGLYFVRVRASNSSGVGEPSTERVIRVRCGGVPPVPSGLTGSVTPGGVVTLSWPPIDEATSYVIEAGSATGLADLAVLPVRLSVVSGTVPVGTYYVRVRATTACGTTSPSNEIRRHRALAALPRWPADAELDRRAGSVGCRGECRVLAEPSVTHQVDVGQVQRWPELGSTNPNEEAKRKRLRQ